jgi:hypothetical protein
MAGKYFMQLRYFGQYLFFVPRKWWASAESNCLSRHVKTI